MSDTVPMIYAQISKVMADIGAIGKERQNVEQKYKFRGIEDLYNAAHPAMVKHGVFCAPSVLEYESSERPTRSGGVATRIIMRISHRFYAADGSFVEAITTGEGIDHSDKAANKCLSAAMKYALIELFCVPTQDIEEADSTTPDAGDGAKPAVRTFKRPNVRTETALPASEAPAATTDAAVESEFLRKDQQDHFRLKFKEALAIQYQPHADQLRRALLAELGYVGPDGVGTSKAVPQAKFKEVLRKAVVAAKKYSEPEGPAAVSYDTDSVPF